MNQNSFIHLIFAFIRVATILQPAKVFWLSSFSLLVMVALSACTWNNETSVLTDFNYQVRVQTANAGDYIENATVTLEVKGQAAPLDGITDSRGVARIFISSAYIGQPGFLIVEAPGHKKFTQNIDLTEASLPDVVQLEPIPISTDTPTPLPIASTDTPTATPTHSPTPLATAASTATPIEPTDTPASIPTPSLVASSINAYFFDDFDGTELDQQKWEFITAANQTQLSNGLLRLSSTGRTFPFIYSKANPFPLTGNFSLKLAMRYLSAAERGAGFRIGTAIAAYGADQDRDITELFKGRIIEVWQDATNWRITVGEENTQVFAWPAPELKTHVLEINYTENVYLVILDGEVVYTSPANVTRPTILWFGNPAQVDADGAWSGLEIDYIGITAATMP